MSATITEIHGGDVASIGNMFERFLKMALDSTYSIGGESVTHNALGFDDLPGDLIVHALQKEGYRFEYISLTEKMRVFWPYLGPGLKTVGIKDDDSAASNGVAVYVHVDEVYEQGTVMAHLECVNAGNADSYFCPWNGGPKIPVQDDDNAATAGVALFFDENDTAGIRLSADFDRITDTDTSPSVLVPTGDGGFLRIKDQDSPSGESGTVQVYFDDDAANDYERLLFVSPTNANGSDRYWVPGGEVPDGTSLADITDVILRVIGRTPITL